MFRKTIQDGRQKIVPMDQGQTDDQGYYRLGHVSPGTYFIVFSARPWYAQNTRDVMQRRRPSGDDNSEPTRDANLDVTYPLTFYPDAFDSAGASPLIIHPGDHLTADAVMHAVPAIHLRIRTGGGETPARVSRIFILEFRNACSMATWTQRSTHRSPGPTLG